ncbi:hypothetical protein [Brevundimonas sp. Root1279]|uniref:hypothetical protein n=1 Tax=Brevundimonas sp. Root1279 TaxID=1736443 RepID=UPI0006F76447|nr:hypothetical protein [Brevundimonas sp. Root1279]KQW83107.1 hypothetical protein ASC65_07180 [Brevundimonas sp. Root1279]
MKTALATLAAATLLAGTAAAQDPAPTPARQVIRDSDSTLTCVQIADEAAQLSEAMGGSPGNSTIGALTDVAKAGAATFIPGAGLLIAGADALTQGDRQRRAIERLAQMNRWFYLNGLYSGRGCMDNPTPAATEQAEPVPNAAAPTAPAVTAPPTPSPRPQ